MAPQTHVSDSESTDREPEDLGKRVPHYTKKHQAYMEEREHAEKRRKMRREKTTKTSNRCDEESEAGDEDQEETRRDKVSSLRRDHQLDDLSTHSADSNSDEDDDAPHHRASKKHTKTSRKKNNTRGRSRSPTPLYGQWREPSPVVESRQTRKGDRPSSPLRRALTLDGEELSLESTRPHAGKNSQKRRLSPIPGYISPVNDELNDTRGHKASSRRLSSPSQRSMSPVQHRTVSLARSHGTHKASRSRGAINSHTARLARSPKDCTTRQKGRRSAKTHSRASRSSQVSSPSRYRSHHHSKKRRTSLSPARRDERHAKRGQQYQKASSKPSRSHKSSRASESADSDGEEEIDQEDHAASSSEREGAQKKKKKRAIPRRKDFTKPVQEAIDEAYADFKAKMATHGPFPSAEELVAEAKNALRRASVEVRCKESIPESAATVVKTSLTNFRSGMIPKVRTEVQIEYGLGHPDGKHFFKDDNVECVKNLCEKGNFTFKYHYPEEKPRGVYYCRLISKLINHLFFEGGDESLGIKFDAYFHPIPTELIAFVCTMVEHCIKEWEDGEHIKAEFKVTGARRVYAKHMTQLEKWAVEQPTAFAQYQIRLYNQGRKFAKVSDDQTPVVDGDIDPHCYKEVYVDSSDDEPPLAVPEKARGKHSHTKKRHHSTAASDDDNVSKKAKTQHDHEDQGRPRPRPRRRSPSIDFPLTSMKNQTQKQKTVEDESHEGEHEEGELEGGIANDMNDN